MICYTCPFWKNKGNGGIICEGGKIYLGNSDVTREFSLRYCAGRYKECGIYRYLSIYYERKENEE